MNEESPSTDFSSDSSVGDPSKTSPEPLTWRVHPMLERKWTALFAIIVVGSIGAVIQKWDGDYLFAMLAVLVLLLSLNRFFFPSTFELSNEGITARYPLRTRSCKWDDVERWVGDRRAAWIRLKGHPKQRDLELILGGRHDEVLKYLSQRANGRIL